MLRIILGIIVGFVVWSIVWVGSDELLINSIDWYGEHQHGFEKAMFNRELFTPLTVVLFMNIIRSVIISLMAGFMAALAANENKRVTIILGVVLLIVGASVEVMDWDYLPVWYHLLFLVLLIPATIAGGKLRKVN
jgi:uncharacterized membrane protein YeaQ/YmgE (transglycosylase-associated protein family)